MTDQAPASAAPQSRLEIWVRRYLLGFFVAVVLVLLGWWWRAQTLARQADEELAVAVAETDALDPRWRWEHIEEDRQPLPDKRNSVDVILQIAKLRNKQQDGDLYCDELPVRPANRLLEATTVARIQEALATQAQAIALAASLIDFPHGRGAFPADADFLTLPPHVQPCREVAWVLTLDSDSLLHEGRVHAAARHIHAILHTGASLRDEGQTISQLVRIAVRAIAVGRVEMLLGRGEPDEATLARLQDHFMAEATESLLLPMLRGERALVHRTLTKWADKSLNAEKLRGQVEPATLAVIQKHGLPREHAAYLRLMNRIVAIANVPAEKQSAAWDALEAEMVALRRAAAEDPEDGLFAPLVQGGQKKVQSVFATQFVPALWKVGEASLRDRTMMLCTGVALAVERYRRAQQRWPATLAELVPAYMPAVPIDPYSGSPLLYKVFADGVAVYSVSRNGVDDGGIRISPAHFHEPDSDLGVRLWDPPHRRLPPLPPENAPDAEPVPLREVAP
jgi:hypothetical protein